MAFLKLPVFGRFAAFEDIVNGVHIRTRRNIDTNQPAICSLVRTPEVRKRFPQRAKLFLVHRLGEKDAISRVSSSLRNASNREPTVDFCCAHDVLLTVPISKERNVSETVKSAGDRFGPYCFDFIAWFFQLNRHLRQLLARVAVVFHAVVLDYGDIFDAALQ